MKPAFLFLFQFFFLLSQAQVKISGAVVTKPEKPVSGVNLFIQGTYDGTTSDSLGHFEFRTEASGEQTLIASCIGFETQAIQLELSSNISNMKIELVEEINELNEVTINAGTFEASDKKKSVILKPLDIALTASANGDIFGAFGTLPGSHKVGEEGRLFVRGGESYETKTFMDGMLINTPYFSKMPDLPTRGRFSPLLFNGSVFSTGGYSAEYGQALSSIVALNTVALEPEDKSSISIMTVGVQGAHAKRWKNTSLALTGEYLHTGLSNRIIKQNIEWVNDPVIVGSTLMFRHKTSETGMIKTFGSFSYDASTLLHNNFQQSAMQEISLNNKNVYVNTTFNEMLTENWILQTGVALNADWENIKPGNDELFTSRKSGQLKFSLTNTSVKNLSTQTGAEYMFYDYNQDIIMDDNFQLTFSNHQVAAFAESELKATRHLALKAGVRAEHHSILQKTSIVPRLSAAVKTGKYSQFSAAHGLFFQNPPDDYLKFSARLSPEKSSHSILTWQFRKDTRTLRIEAYYKDYSNLVKFKEEFSMEPKNYNNTGSGYSRGIDVFWRNQKEFGKSDYWISYSWIDSKRNYRDFPKKVTPHYVSKHNFSVVYKRFLLPVNSFVSASYSFASGRPYFNPNNPQFMTDRTKTYNDLSLGLTRVFYLFNTQAVAHLVLNNVLGFNNVFGYNYSATPDQSGIFQLQPIIPAQKRMAIFLISFQL